MPVTKYLERAREAAALADSMTGDDKKRVLEIAETWRKIAVIEAAEMPRRTATKGVSSASKPSQDGQASRGDWVA